MTGCKQLLLIRYDEELASQELQSQESRSRSGTSGTATRPIIRDQRKPGHATWK